MIIDTLDNIGKYESLNPLFKVVTEFLQAHKPDSLPVGQVVLRENDLWINTVETGAKTREAARLETHDRMIDIQIPLTGEEEMGYCPRAVLAPAPYDPSDDISFYEEKPLAYFKLQPGMFAVFFPEDGHAPAITPTGLKKIIVKVRA